MKNIKKLKEAIKDYSFLDLLEEDLSQYNLLAEYKQNTIVLIGIGGSSLGAKVISSLSKSKKKVIFLDHLNSNFILDLLKQLDPIDTLYLIQSKSGKTQETLALYSIFKKWLIDNQSSLSRNIIYSSDPGTFLEQEAIQNGSVFYKLNPNVGGRYSAFSCMGLVLAKLLEIDIYELISSAKLYPQYLNNIQELALATFESRVKTIVNFSYNHKLPYLNEWIVQLIAESLGKSGKEYLPISCTGVKDQHSFLQLLSDGIKNKLIFFYPPFEGQQLAIPGYDYTINQLLEAEYLATFESLKLIHSYYEFDDNVNLNKYLGKIIIFFEIFTAYLGELNSINPFDQPGVENSKKITQEILTKK